MRMRSCSRRVSSQASSPTGSRSCSSTWALMSRRAPGTQGGREAAVVVARLVADGTLREARVHRRGLAERQPAATAELRAGEAGDGAALKTGLGGGRCRHGSSRVRPRTRNASGPKCRRARAPEAPGNGPVGAAPIVLLVTCVGGGYRRSSMPRAASCSGPWTASRATRLAAARNPSPTADRQPVTATGAVDAPPTSAAPPYPVAAATIAAASSSTVARCASPRKLSA